MVDKKETPRKSGEHTKQKRKTKTTKPNTEERLRRKLREAKEENAVLKDRLLRTAAEMDNMRKRTQRELSRMVQEAGEGVLRDILPILDDLERSLKTAEDNENGQEFRKGVELIHQKMLAVITNHGLKPMESEGKPFDVNLHDALMQVKKKGVPPGIVIEEHIKGYLLNDKVLRHAKVVVSK
jgi:molecular chaperone GrpE